MEKDYDLLVENFNGLFDIQVASMNSGHKAFLPTPLLIKLFNIRGKPTTKKLTFFQKIYVLFRAFNKRIFLVIEDHERGIGIDDFTKYKKEYKKRLIESTQVDDLLSKGACVLGNKELVDWLSHLNRASMSSFYNYALKVKNCPPSKFPDHKKYFIYFSNLLTRYEGNKKTVTRELGINVTDLYILSYLYDGKEKSGSATYTTVYKSAFGSSKKQFIMSFKRLQTMGYIDILSSGRFAKYRITALGTDVFNNIVKKYVIP